jgi:NitT/TauT family transport system substrate-binding protein
MNPLGVEPRDQVDVVDARVAVALETFPDLAIDRRHRGDCHSVSPLTARQHSPGKPAKGPIVTNRRRAIAAIAGYVLIAERRPAGAQALVPLHIGCVLGESYSNAFYAQDGGFFKQAGLDVTIDTFASGGTITAAVTAGALDVGAGSTTSSANAHVRGLPIRLIAPGGVYTTESPTTMLAVTRTSPLRTAKDLAGKTVAVTTLRDLTQVSVMSWLDKNGGDAKATAFIEIAPSAMAPTLLSGRADAVFIGEPYMTQAKEQIQIIGSPYDAIAKRFLIIGWTATKDWLDKNTATARRFVAAMRAADEWASRNRAESLTILGKYTKVPVDVLLAMHHNVWVPKLEVSLVQPVIDASAHYQTLPHGFPATEMFYPGLD